MCHRPDKRWEKWLNLVVVRTKDKPRSLPETKQQTQ